MGVLNDIISSAGCSSLVYTRGMHGGLRVAIVFSISCQMIVVLQGMGGGIRYATPWNRAGMVPLYGDKLHSAKIEKCISGCWEGQGQGRG